MTPEPYPLTNANFKTQRAQAHLHELKAAIEAFEKSQPYTLRPQAEPDGNAIRYCVEIRHPPVGLFLIAADVLQCLRTALDQAIWSLARLKYPNTDPDWTQFPVFSEPLDAKARKKFDRQVLGVPDKAIQFIEALQPYNRPAGTPLASSLLWQLHELNRIDKHRRILVRAMFTGISRSTFGVSIREDFALFRMEVRDYGCDVIC